MKGRQVGQLDTREVKKGTALTKTASGGWRTKVAKAALISLLVLAFRTWICRPMACTTASTSLNVNSVLSIDRIGKHGYPSGSSCWFQPFRRARLATRPSLTGSSAVRKSIGIVVVAALAANGTVGPAPETTASTGSRSS